MKKLLAIALLAAVSSTPATAETFSFSFSSSTVSGSGLFQATNLNNGSFEVTGVSGSTTFNSVTRTILGLGGNGGSPDNLIFPQSAVPFDGNGVTYLQSDLTQVNLFASAQFPGFSRVNLYDAAGGSQQNFPANSGITITVTAVADALPEPATWAMLVAGFGIVGGAMRRRRTIGAFA